MAQAVTALQQTRLVDSAGSRNLKIVFGGSESKLLELSRNVVEDFRADVFRLAEANLANTTGANVDSFCNAWTQVLERYKNRSQALTTFKTEFVNTINFFIRDHRDELQEELLGLVEKCDVELKQRNQVDESILAQKAILEGWIKDLRTYDHTGKYQGKGQKKTVYKRASKRATKSTTKTTSKANQQS